jgi:nucleotide-binding universal stress UspA family protein
MFAKILIPIDSSPTSAAALHQGLQLARLLGSQVVLLHVLASDQRQARSEAEALLTAAATGARFRPKCCLVVATSGETAEIAAWIVTLAQSEQADLIVMGTRGGGLCLGSTAQAVAASSPVPVHIVPLVASERRSYLERAQPSPSP